MHCADELFLARSVEPPTKEDLAAFWARHVARTARNFATVDAAFCGGVHARPLAFAFAAGYACALRALFPSLGPASLASFAVTEESGNAPRSIRTRLHENVLRGKKTWVTLGPTSNVLFIAARTNELDEARANIRIVRVPLPRTGVRAVPLESVRFVPEIPHAQVELEDVRVEDGEILDGDGYERYVKPFRTVEDLHVMAAFLGWIGGLAVRSAWPQSIAERVLAEYAAVRELSAREPMETTTHIALGGVFSNIQRLIDEVEPLWATVTPDVRDTWKRDRALLNVASAAREKRLSRAWQRALHPREDGVMGRE